MLGNADRPGVCRPNDAPGQACCPAIGWMVKGGTVYLLEMQGHALGLGEIMQSGNRPSV